MLAWAKRLQLRPTNVDTHYPFNPLVFKKDRVNIIFLLTAIIIPFGLGIILNIILSDQTTINVNNAIILVLVVNLISAAIGLVLIMQRVRTDFLLNGALAFYLFLFIPTLIGLLSGIILVVIDPGNNNGIAKSPLFIGVTNLVSEGITCFCIFYFCPWIRKKLFQTLKYQYRIYLWLAPLCVVAMYGFTAFFDYLQSFINNSTSDNQASLNNLLSTWYGIVFLIAFSVILAPIVEEAATRHGIFLLSGSKRIGFFASLIYFAGMHVNQNLDWQHLLLYFGGSLVLCTTFVLANYNLTYTVLAHAGFNLLAVIIGVVQK